MKNNIRPNKNNEKDSHLNARVLQTNANSLDTSICCQEVDSGSNCFKVGPDDVINNQKLMPLNLHDSMACENLNACHFTDSNPQMLYSQCNFLTVDKLNPFNLSVEARQGYLYELPVDTNTINSGNINSGVVENVSNKNFSNNENPSKNLVVNTLLDDEIWHDHSLENNNNNNKCSAPNDSELINDITNHGNGKLKDKPRNCSFCGRIFKYPSDLKKHAVIHNESRKYNCDICDKSFRREHQLAVHKRIHTGEKPFTCQYCGATFRHDSTYSLHVRTKHDNIKPFYCEKCRKTFGRLSHLRKHQKFVCKIEQSIEISCSNNAYTEPNLTSKNTINCFKSQTFINKSYSENSLSNKNNEKIGDSKLLLHSSIHSPNNSINTSGDIKTNVIIRCQYCLKEFRKTLDLRNHLNCAGNCNLMYLMDLKKKEKSREDNDFDSDLVLPPICSLLFPTRSSIAKVESANNLSNNYHFPSDYSLENNHHQLNTESQKLAMNTIDNNDTSSDYILMQRQSLPINEMDPLSQPPCNMLAGVQTSFDSCFDNANDCSSFFTSTNNFLNNLIPSSLFYDTQMFDIFKDIDTQPNESNDSIKKNQNK